jgi:putative spermidine/putrescine transport system ATP-binding protein
VVAAYLDIQNVSKSYDGRTNAVDCVSIGVQKGEFVTFLGPSGSGKTTTLMMVAGFEDPTSGRIVLAGQDLTRRRPWQRNVGVVFQNYALFPHMTVERNVAFPLRMRGVARDEARRRVTEVLALVGLLDFAPRYPRALSGGQQQRVALARGLVFQPDVLLLDEPLGALDKNLREQMQVEIKRIHREIGLTMIYVTHDQSEAMTMSDRVVVFNRGRVEQVGAPLDVYRRPRTRFVGAFIGDSNFFSARRDPDSPDRLRCGQFGTIGLPADAAADAAAFDVMIRPEQMRLLNGPMVDGLIAVPATVTRVINHGDSTMVACSAAGTTVRVRVTGDLPDGVIEGEPIAVGWAAKDMHFIPCTEGTAAP